MFSSSFTRFMRWIDSDFNANSALSACFSILSFSTSSRMCSIRISFSSICWACFWSLALKIFLLLGPKSPRSKALHWALLTECDQRFALWFLYRVFSDTAKSLMLNLPLSLSSSDRDQREGTEVLKVPNNFYKLLDLKINKKATILPCGERFKFFSKIWCCKSC